ncbi:tetratricopeptide repeat protein [bacterium]|nr:tetratricopeptide repeat protein [bacterium]
MLNPLSKTKKKPNIPDDPLEKGLELIKGDLFKQATDHFKKVIEKDPGILVKKLQKLFETYYLSQNSEAAIAVGVVVLQDLESDCTFLNKLGNCFRRLNHHQKANDLYRKALRVDKTNKNSLYNLAASLAKVDKFDSEIPRIIDQYISSDEYILPGYLNDPDLIENINQQLDKEKEAHGDRIQSLIEEKKLQSELNNVDAVKELIQKIEAEERKLNESTYEAVSKRIRNANKKNWARKTIEETKTVLQENLFNLGLYAFSQKDISLASECFQKLKKEKNDIENLDLMIALVKSYQNSTKEAIEYLIPVLSKKSNNRLLNINLGLFYKKEGNQLLSYRYLVKGCSLLEQSDGLFDLTEILKRANEYFEHHNPDKALILYQAVTDETPNTHALIRIGELLIEKEELVEAIMSLREAQDIEPDNSAARQKLLEIHDIYCLKAETCVRREDFIAAAKLYQNALELHRSTAVLIKAAIVHEKLEDWSKARALRQESEQIQTDIKEEKYEQQRQLIIEKGKKLMKKKDYNSAIELLEKAFEMKPDKDVFMLLAHIFKRLNQSRRLSSLMSRWKLMMDREIRMKDVSDE